MDEVRPVSRTRVAALVLLSLVATLLTGCATGGAGDGAPTTSHLARYLPSPGGASAPSTRPRTTEPTARATPVDYCRSNTARQLVLVSIARQHAWLCERSRTVYSTAVTTGMDTPKTHTPTGTFHIQGRNRDSVLTQSNGDRYHVKYWIPFEAPEYGFHDASWQHVPYGGPQYRTSGSHGCVHLPLAAMKYLYDWVKIGASVTIRA